MPRRHRLPPLLLLVPAPVPVPSSPRQPRVRRLLRHRSLISELCQQAASPCQFPTASAAWRGEAARAVEDALARQVHDPEVAAGMPMPGGGGAGGNGEIVHLQMRGKPVLTAQ